MKYTPQQSDFEVIQNNNRVVNIRLELLNRNMQIVDTLHGSLMQDSYVIDATSEVRRTYTATIIVTDSSFKVGRDTKIWMDKLIRVSVGIFYIPENDFRWYSIGLFVFTTTNYSFNATTQTLNITCVDLVANLNGARNGQLSGHGTSIPAVVADKNNEPELDVNGNPIRNMIRSAMLSTVTQLGEIKRYRIEDIGESVPYDLNFDAGATVWSIISTLRDLYPAWETYFDEDLFVYQPIPTYTNEPILMDARALAEFVVSENTALNFGDIYNVVEIFGKTLDAQYFTSDCVMSSDGAYNLTYADTVTSLTNGTTFGFKASANNIDGMKIKINDFVAYPVIMDGNIAIPSNTIIADEVYVIKYVVNGAESNFYLQGQYQIHSVSKLYSKMPSQEQISYDLANEFSNNITYVINPDNPFCIDYGLGEIRQVLSDGEYANIYTDKLCKERSDYELWKNTYLKDTIELSMVNIPFLDVNTKVEYYSNNLGRTDTYLVLSIRGSTSNGLSNVVMVRYQPLYPWITEGGGANLKYSSNAR
jgi:hypothetical protein